MQPGQQRLTGFVQPQPPADVDDATADVSSLGAWTPLSCRLVRAASSSCIAQLVLDASMPY